MSPFVIGNRQHGRQSFRSLQPRVLGLLFVTCSFEDQGCKVEMVHNWSAGKRPTRQRNRMIEVSAIGVKQECGVCEALHGQARLGNSKSAGAVSRKHGNM